MSFICSGRKGSNGRIFQLKTVLAWNLFFDIRKMVKKKGFDSCNMTHIGFKFFMKKHPIMYIPAFSKR